MELCLHEWGPGGTLWLITCPFPACHTEVPYGDPLEESIWGCRFGTCSAIASFLRAELYLCPLSRRSSGCLLICISKVVGVAGLRGWDRHQEE